MSGSLLSSSSSSTTDAETVRATIASTTLCLACSGSLPPSAHARETIFITRCCQKPICPQCLLANPRLSRYHPCLSCLAGASAVATTSLVGKRGKFDGASREQPEPTTTGSDRSLNLDGSLRETDVFVLGDEDEDDQDSDETGGDVEVEVGTSQDVLRGSGRAAAPTLPPHSLVPTTTTSSSSSPATSTTANDAVSLHKEVPSKHFIQKGDTLLGIAFKYGVDGRALCRLNALPTSTLSTTPHLLHTRTVLVLPTSARASAQTVENKDSTVNDDALTVPVCDGDRDNEEGTGLERRRVRARELERAAKRLQCVTKETDWRVASAYAALAELKSPGEEDEWRAKRKELGFPAAGTTAGRDGLAARAADAYLEDDEWEARERASGRGPPSASTSSRVGAHLLSSQANRAAAVNGLGSWSWLGLKPVPGVSSNGREKGKVA